MTRKQYDRLVHGLRRGVLSASEQMVLFTVFEDMEQLLGDLQSKDLLVGTADDGWRLHVGIEEDTP